jgi:GrpB-like predicted nucleotidyltransferase (UPF0157 family)
MNQREQEDAARIRGLDAIAHRAFVLFGESRRPISPAALDERITVCTADPSWPNAFQQEAARLQSVLPCDLVPDIQHIGSTAVPGLDAKPILDVMVGLGEPGRIAETVTRLEQFDYESLGEAGVPGRWALRRRNVAQPSNIAIVAYQGEWWKLNLAVRDYLRANAEAARNYALAKWHAVSGGADMLLAYSDAKRVMIEKIAAEARALPARDGCTAASRPSPGSASPE